MEKLRIAVVGYGNIGKYTVQALQAAPDMEIAGIVRRNGAADKPGPGRRGRSSPRGSVCTPGDGGGDGASPPARPPHPVRWRRGAWTPAP